MAEFRGTQGKWEVVVQNETGSLITGMNGNETICTVWGNVDEFEANAQLIESAPDLLEAALKALNECCDLIGTEAGNALEAAIKKATE